MKSLDASKLAEFEPKPKTPVSGGGEGAVRGQGRTAPRSAPDPKAWPSREVRDGQIGIRGPVETLDEFKALCKLERRNYYDMLGVLMENYSSPEK